MGDIGEQFEKLIYRAIRQQAEGAISDLVEDVVQAKVDRYVADHELICSLIHRVIDKRIDLVSAINENIGDIVSDQVCEMVDNEIQDIKVGDKSCLIWLTEVMIERIMEKDSIQHFVEECVKTQIQLAAQRIFAAGLSGLNGTPA